ncbi:NACHT domain-containing protein [Nannocystis punicea]|uniref:ATP-binding protein n=1 Tax=Nannocystis punicea TaxID=2995304 RepID=A0ABY7HB38_9BACT|nr:ATP-binding protein [Nannocystis poenicansa]WAS96477.1 ATP-binding protein [Nannocystis poenicansa]
MASAAADLHAFLVRRYTDPQKLWQLVDLQLGPELSSELPVGAPAKTLAHNVVKCCQEQGRTLELFAALEGEAGNRGEELARIIAAWLVEHEDPSLNEARERYAEHARRTARRPPLDTQVARFLDDADYDLDRVWIPLTSRPLAPPQQPRIEDEAEKRQRTEIPPTQVVEAAAPVLELWPKQTRWLVLLGDPGAGKSVVARRALIEQLGVAERTPVRIELGRYATWAARQTGRRDLLRFLGEAFGEDGVPLSELQLRSLALADRLTWIVDGLDEIADADLRSRCVEQLANLRHRGPVLVTTRPRGVAGPREALREAGYAIHEMCPLDDATLTHLGRRWREAGLIDEAALQRALSTASVREQMRSPLIATFVLVLARKGTPLQQRQRVLAEISALMVRTWAERRRPLLLDASGRMAFLRGLAWTMLTAVERGAENVIEHAALHRFAARFFRERERLSRDEAAARADDLIAELKLDVHALSQLGGESYGFVHRSLLEFFAADALAESTEEVILARFADWQQGTWTEVLPMTCGLLAGHDAPLAVRAVQRVFADCAPLASSQLLAAGEFAVRCFAEIEAPGPEFGPLAATLTELWIAQASLGELDMRGLAAALRPIGPRWPGARRLWEWSEATGGRGFTFAIPEYSVQLDSGPRLLPLVHVVVAVTAAAARPRLLARLLDKHAVLTPFAEGLAAMGPWTDAERELLTRSLDRFGWPWDAQVVAWLGDLAGTTAEARLLALLSDEGRSPIVRLFTAALLLSSSTRRAEAVAALADDISELAELSRTIALQEVNAQIVATLLRSGPAAADELCGQLMAQETPELRAIACLVAAHRGDETAAAAFVAMLRCDDRRSHDAANWALAQGLLRDGIDRVLTLLHGDPSCLTLAWAAMTAPVVAEQRGRWEFAQTLWCHLADAGEWSANLRWLAVAALLARPAWRELGMQRLGGISPDTEPNSPNMDTALRRLGEHPDGPERLRELLAAETDRVRRRWIAQALLERVPADLAAAAELRRQAHGSTDRAEQYLLAQAMRRLGLPRADWAPLAPKILAHAPHPIARCAAATLLGDCTDLRRLEAELAANESDPRQPSVDAEVRALAGALLRCEALRLQLAGGADDPAGPGLSSRR